jgi:hypothetical protein
VPVAEIPQCLRHLAEREAAIESRGDLAGLTELDDAVQVLDAELDRQHSYLLVPGPSDHRPGEQDLQEGRDRPSDIQIVSSWQQGTQVGKGRAISSHIEDQVVAASVPGEVLSRVVDDVVGA